MLSDVLIPQGEFGSAREAFEKSLDIRKRLVATDPSNTRWQLDLVTAYYKVALTDAERSAELFESGFGVLNELQNSGRLPPDKESWIAAFEAKLADN